MRREWNLEYQREIIALRTVWAFPTGITPWLQDKQVLEDVIDGYPAVWQFAINLDHATRQARGRFSLLRRSSPLVKRLPVQPALIGPVLKLV